MGNRRRRKGNVLSGGATRRRRYKGENLIGHCIVCDKKIKTGTPMNSILSWSIAWGGVMFHSDGNFGSTTYDNIDEQEYIQIFVCDECMKKKAKKIWRVKTVRNMPDDAEFTTFDVEPEWLRGVPSETQAYRNSIRRKSSKR